MKFSATAFRLRNWRSPEARRMSYLEYVLANDDHAKEVKAFGLGPVLLRSDEVLGHRLPPAQLAIARSPADELPGVRPRQRRPRQGGQGLRPRAGAPQI